MQTYTLAEGCQIRAGEVLRLTVRLMNLSPDGKSIMSHLPGLL